MCIRDSSGAVTGLLAVPVSTLFAEGIDYGEYKTNRRIEGMGSAITVSYTHLDVYKRQLHWFLMKREIR